MHLKRIVFIFCCITLAASGLGCGNAKTQAPAKPGNEQETISDLLVGCPEPGACLLRYNSALVEGDSQCCFALGGTNQCNIDIDCNELSGPGCCTIYATSHTRLGSSCCLYSDDDVPYTAGGQDRTEDCELLLHTARAGQVHSDCQ